VWTIQTACTQDQTPFARKKRLQYTLGGGICELEQDAQTGAIIGCQVRMFGYFDAGYYTNNRFSLSGGVAVNPVTYGGLSMTPDRREAQTLDGRDVVDRSPDPDDESLSRKPKKRRRR
jgi:hypothetical protein